MLLNICLVTPSLSLHYFQLRAESGKESERESGRDSPLSRRGRVEDDVAASSEHRQQQLQQQQRNKDNVSADPTRLLEMAGYGGSGGGRDERRGRGPGGHDRSKTWDVSDKGELVQRV